MIKRVLLFSLFLALVATFNVPMTYAGGMQDDVDRAVTIIQAFRDMPEKSIPPEVLRNAKGVAIMTVIKAGFIVSGRGGSGVVVARTGKGWSGPSAIGTGGAGFGFQIGAEQTEFVFVLNTHEAVKAFSQGGNVQFGGNISAAAGPVGRTVETGVTPVAAVYAYSRSQGFSAASLLRVPSLRLETRGTQSITANPSHRGRSSPGRSRRRRGPGSFKRRSHGIKPRGFHGRKSSMRDLRPIRWMALRTRTTCYRQSRNNKSEDQAGSLPGKRGFQNPFGNIYNLPPLRRHRWEASRPKSCSAALPA